MQTVFSRTYLQSIPQKKKEETIDRIISEFSHELLSDAESGKTMYMYETHRLDLHNNRIRHRFPPPLQISLDDLADRFKQRFPGCSISYQETWIIQNNNTKILKKGVVIDWSLELD